MTSAPRRITTLSELAGLKRAGINGSADARPPPSARPASGASATSSLRASVRSRRWRPAVAPSRTRRVPQPDPQRRRDEAAALRETLLGRLRRRVAAPDRCRLILPAARSRADVVRKLRRRLGDPGPDRPARPARDQAREALAAFVRDAERRGAAASSTARATARPARAGAPAPRTAAGWFRSAGVLAFTQACCRGGSGALVVLFGRKRAAGRRFAGAQGASLAASAIALAADDPGVDLEGSSWRCCRLRRTAASDGISPTGSRA